MIACLHFYMELYYCLSDFQVIRVHEEFFLPGEVIMEQGNAVDQLYFVCHGVLVRYTSLLILFNFVDKQRFPEFFILL